SERFGISGRPAVVLTLEATLDDAGQVRTDAADQTEAARRAQQIRDAQAVLMERLLGDRDDLAGELQARIVADRRLLVGYHRWRPDESLLPYLARLLGEDSGGSASAPNPALSEDLRRQLEDQRRKEERRLEELHR